MIDITTTKSLLQATSHTNELYKAIVNIPFDNRVQSTNLGLGIVVLLLSNPENKTLDRIALSDTELAAGAVKMSAKPFHEIKIPLDQKSNILIQAIQSQRYTKTTDWATMFTPVLTAQEARFNQAGAGIDCSVVYPLLVQNATDSSAIGAMIYSYFEPLNHISKAHHEFMESYTTIVAAFLANATS